MTSIQHIPLHPLHATLIHVQPCETRRQCCIDSTRTQQRTRSTCNWRHLIIIVTILLALTIPTFQRSSFTMGVHAESITAEPSLPETVTSDSTSAETIRPEATVPITAMPPGDSIGAGETIDTKPTEPPPSPLSLDTSPTPEVPTSSVEVASPSVELTTATPDDVQPVESMQQVESKIDAPVNDTQVETNLTTANITVAEPVPQIATNATEVNSTASNLTITDATPPVQPIETTNDTVAESVGSASAVANETIATSVIPQEATQNVTVTEPTANATTSPTTVETPPPSNMTAKSIVNASSVPIPQSLTKLGTTEEATEPAAPSPSTTSEPPVSATIPHHQPPSPPIVTPTVIVLPPAPNEDIPRLDAYKASVLEVIAEKKGKKDRQKKQEKDAADAAANPPATTSSTTVQTPNTNGDAPTPASTPTSLPAVLDTSSSPAASTSDPVAPKSDPAPPAQPIDPTIPRLPETKLSDHEKDRFNYAAFDAGAKLLSTSDGMKKGNSILISDDDRYMMVPCEKENKTFVIQLSEDIIIDTIELANLEHYASSIKDFQVLGSATHPTTEWVLLGSYLALPSTQKQVFTLPSKEWVRFIKIHWTSHYGSEYYCTLTYLRVYGMTMLETFREEMQNSENEVKEMTQELIHIKPLGSPKEEPVIAIVQPLVIAPVHVAPVPALPLTLPAVHPTSRPRQSSFYDVDVKTSYPGDAPIMDATAVQVAVEAHVEPSPPVKVTEEARTETPPVQVEVTTIHDSVIVTSTDLNQTVSNTTEPIVHVVNETATLNATATTNVDPSHAEASQAIDAPIDAPTASAVKSSHSSLLAKLVKEQLDAMGLHHVNQMEIGNSTAPANTTLPNNSTIAAVSNTSIPLSDASTAVEPNATDSVPVQSATTIPATTPSTTPAAVPPITTSSEIPPVTPAAAAASPVAQSPASTTSVPTQPTPATPTVKTVETATPTNAAPAVIPVVPSSQPAAVTPTVIPTTPPASPPVIIVTPSPAVAALSSDPSLLADTQAIIERINHPTLTGTPIETTPHKDPPKPSSSGSGSGGGGAAGQQSIFKALTNRIKELEIHQALANNYVSDLADKYSRDMAALRLKMDGMVLEMAAHVARNEKQWMDGWSLMNQTAEYVQADNHRVVQAMKDQLEEAQDVVNVVVTMIQVQLVLVLVIIFGYFLGRSLISLVKHLWKCLHCRRKRQPLGRHVRSKSTPNLTILAGDLAMPEESLSGSGRASRKGSNAATPMSNAIAMSARDRQQQAAHARAMSMSVFGRNGTNNTKPSHLSGSHSASTSSSPLFGSFRRNVSGPTMSPTQVSFNVAEQFRNEAPHGERTEEAYISQYVTDDTEADKIADLDFSPESSSRKVLPEERQPIRSILSRRGSRNSMTQTDTEMSKSESPASVSISPAASPPFSRARGSGLLSRWLSSPVAEPSTIPSPASAPVSSTIVRPASSASIVTLTSPTPHIPSAIPELHTAPIDSVRDRRSRARTLPSVMARSLLGGVKIVAVSTISFLGRSRSRTSAGSSDASPNTAKDEPKETLSAGGVSKSRSGSQPAILIPTPNNSSHDSSPLRQPLSAPMRQLRQSSSPPMKSSSPAKATSILIETANESEDLLLPPLSPIAASPLPTPAPTEATVFKFESNPSSATEADDTREDGHPAAN